MIGAGSLNYRLTFSAPDLIQGPAGETVPTFVEKYTVWGSVRTENAREVLRNGRIEADLAYSIRVRYIEAIRQNWQITFNGKCLAIEKLIPVGNIRFEDLDIIATEVK